MILRRARTKIQKSASPSYSSLLHLRAADEPNLLHLRAADGPKSLLHEGEVLLRSSYQGGGVDSDLSAGDPAAAAAPPERASGSPATPTALGNGKLPWNAPVVIELPIRRTDTRGVR